MKIYLTEQEKLKYKARLEYARAKGIETKETLRSIAFRVRVGQKVMERKELLRQMQIGFEDPETGILLCTDFKTSLTLYDALDGSEKFMTELDRFIGYISYSLSELHQRLSSRQIDELFPPVNDPNVLRFPINIMKEVTPSYSDYVAASTMKVSDLKSTVTCSVSPDTNRVEGRVPARLPPIEDGQCSSCGLFCAECVCEPQTVPPPVVSAAAQSREQLIQADAEWPSFTALVGDRAQQLADALSRLSCFDKLKLMLAFNVKLSGCSGCPVCTTHCFRTAPHPPSRQYIYRVLNNHYSLCEKIHGKYLLPFRPAHLRGEDRDLGARRCEANAQSSAAGLQSAWTYKSTVVAAPDGLAPGSPIRPAPG